jgi:DNA-directed RNA polymerase subunit RPC12/RpoP
MMTKPKKCLFCNKEADIFSKDYVECVCLECDAEFAEQRKKILEFRKIYKEQHAVCPRCGSEKHVSTMSAYVLDVNNLELYQNNNRCNCEDCGFTHTVHDRKPKEN